MHRLTWCNERVLHIRDWQEDGWLISDDRTASRFADVTWRLVGCTVFLHVGRHPWLGVDICDFTLAQSGVG